MARSRVDDQLQVGRFHVLDVSFTAPPVLLPVYGFSQVTLPEIQVNLRDIPEGNYEYVRRVTMSASVSDVVLSQGVSLFNSDFYDWVRAAVVGRKPPKTLMIVQFSALGEGANAFPQGAVNIPSGGQISPGVEFAARIPGRAWILRECRPRAYKPGTDFDGLSQDVSIAQLTIAVEEMEEFSMGQ